MEEFPEVPCKRCERRNGLLYTVPLYLPATEAGWQSLCADCFRTVLQTEPSDSQAMHPVKRGRREPAEVGLVARHTTWRVLT